MLRKLLLAGAVASGLASAAVLSLLVTIVMAGFAAAADIGFMRSAAGFNAHALMGVVLAFLFANLCVIAATFSTSRLRRVGHGFSGTNLQRAVTWGGAAIILFLGAPAFAADIATVGDKAVVLPYGDWIVAIVQTVLVAATPVIVTLILTWIGMLFPWARLFISQRMVTKLVENSRDFAINAVAGAAHGQQLSVPVGSQVLATALQRGLNQAGPKLLDAAGGTAGLAEKLFRSLNLHPDASILNTLAPVIDAAPHGTISREVDQAVAAQAAR